MANTDPTSTPRRFEASHWLKTNLYKLIHGGNPVIYCYFGYESPKLRLEMEQVIYVFVKIQFWNISLSISQGTKVRATILQW